MGAGAREEERRGSVREPTVSDDVARTTTPSDVLTTESNALGYDGSAMALRLPQGRALDRLFSSTQRYDGWRQKRLQVTASRAVNGLTGSANTLRSRRPLKSYESFLVACVFLCCWCWVDVLDDVDVGAMAMGTSWRR
ncbi:hypothetical protein SCHPADRAFT_263920 [Schizopora paradoxa]|uniref:Uncharacterized protein n=1 Tax=Schizopora paradoxa TaxID=27342 RepID=A0A0H2RU30_9AGAM|nr:hypothetical protein SCHPADRAFT_263920 [Schizopora paradoxa]